MQRLDLSTAKGVLDLYDHFNKGGMWTAKQVSLISESGGDTLIKCHIPNSFGGPCLESPESGSEYWQVPIKVDDCTFSWELLASGLFREHEIPYLTAGDKEIHPTSREEFSKILESGQEGAAFIKELNERANVLESYFSDKVTGFEYSPIHAHNRKEGAFKKGNRLEIVAELALTQLTSHSTPSDMASQLFRGGDNTTIIPSIQIKRIIPRHF